MNKIFTGDAVIWDGSYTWVVDLPLFIEQSAEFNPSQNVFRIYRWKEKDATLSCEKSIDRTPPVYSAIYPWYSRAQYNVIYQTTDYDQTTEEEFKSFLNKYVENNKLYYEISNDSWGECRIFVRHDIITKIKKLLVNKYCSFLYVYFNQGGIAIPLSYIDINKLQKKDDVLKSLASKMKLANKHREKNEIICFKTRTYISTGELRIFNILNKLGKNVSFSKIYNETPELVEQKYSELISRMGLDFKNYSNIIDGKEANSFVKNYNKLNSTYIRKDSLCSIIRLIELPYEDRLKENTVTISLGTEDTPYCGGFYISSKKGLLELFADAKKYSSEEEYYAWKLALSLKDSQQGIPIFPSEEEIDEYNQQRRGY